MVGQCIRVLAPRKAIDYLMMAIAEDTAIAILKPLPHLPPSPSFTPITTQNRDGTKDMLVLAFQ